MIYSAALVDSRSRLNGSDGKPLDSAKSTHSALMSLKDGLIVTAGFPCQDLSTARRTGGGGLKGSRSSLGLRLIGLLLKTSTNPGDDGCPNCGADCTTSDIPACRFECEPQTLGRYTKEPEGGWLPTPTASNYGYCLGGSAGRVGKKRYSLHKLGIQNPEDWERMMGFPLGHTDISRSETQSCLKPLSSYLQASTQS